ncbi:MAG: hypothetical protein LBT60_06945 [Oscillospiraceae bacterium]|jgi:hypothetical protein|nr:hypothetical protein [Oscillospiraceae bacterium]
MKKILAILLTAALLLLPTGCDAVQSALEDGGLIKGAASGEALYKDLDYLISSPDRSSDYELGTFTFTARTLYDPEETQVDDEDAVLILCYISRNDDDEFYLDVTDLDQATLPAADTMIQVTGFLDGTIYWTEENEQITVLDIKATKLEAYTPPDVDIVAGPTVDVSNTTASGTLTFVGAHRSETAFSSVIVVYFEFENTGSTDTAPPTEKLYFYYGDDYLTGSGVWEPEELDAAALAANAPGITDATYAGKTQLYYYVIEGAEGDSELEIEVYNDDFQTVYSYALPVADDLAGMTQS